MKLLGLVDGVGVEGQSDGKGRQSCAQGFRLTRCYASSEGDGDSNDADEEEHSVFVKTSGDTGEYKWPRKIV